MTVKRAGDFVTAGVLLTVTAPVFLVVALAQFKEGMPVLWRSPRLGRHGRRFDLLSFCTTEPDRVDLQGASGQRVLSVRPGMISYAILRLARDYNTAPVRERLALEANYVDHAGLALDLRLIVRAVVAALQSRGNVKARGRPAR